MNCTIQDVYIKNKDVNSKGKKYVKKDKYTIYIRSSSLLTLRNLVTPFMPESMLYKLGL